MREEIIGDCRLILGNSLDVIDSIGMVDVLITDPPYGIGLTKKTSDFRDSKWFDNGESARSSVVYQDEPDYVADIVREFIPKLLLTSRRALIFCGPQMIQEYPKAASIGSVFTMAGAGRTSWGFQCTHPVLFYGKDPFLQDGLGGRANSFRDDQPNREKIDHPCPKPESWMKWAVDRSSRPGELVLDPFMGSGTTGVACAKLGRRFIGIEKIPHYFDIALRRLESAYRQPRLFDEIPRKKIKHPVLL